MMRNVVRVLKAMITIGLAMVVVAPAAHADILDAIVVAHRGATTSTTAEGTLPAYQYAVRHRADYLDGDIHWAKDGADADTVGAMVINHDATLNRVTNCSGYVSDWLWSSIYDRCRTDVGKQRLIRVVDLLKYGNSVGKKFTLELKPTSITNAQAKQLWSTIKRSPVQLEAGDGRLAALNKVKQLDAADPYYKISYARVTSGSGGWPSVSELKQTSTIVHANKSIPATVMSTYKAGGLKVFLFTGKNEYDYERMAKLGPYGVVVDDVGRFQRWRDAQG
jgi:glycerophosphoryl diester phosphodiesterase